MAASSLEANWAEDSRYDNANWYAALEHHTFPTVFFGLCISDAEAVVAEYRARWLHAPSASAMMAAALRRLTTKLDESIAEVGGAAFVRLSSRSPKDAVCLDPAACELALAGKDTNAKLAWLFQQSMASLRVTSGEQALDIMLDSERCYRDLSAAINVAEDKMRERRRRNGKGEDGAQGGQGSQGSQGSRGTDAAEEDAEEDATQEDGGEAGDAGDVGAGVDDNAWKECLVPQSLQYGWDMMVCVRRWEDQLREVRIRVYVPMYSCTHVLMYLLRTRGLGSRALPPPSDCVTKRALLAPPTLSATDMVSVQLLLIPHAFARSLSLTHFPSLAPPSVAIPPPLPSHPAPPNRSPQQDYEFRGFVNQAGNLIALSQYNHYVFHPHIAEQKEAISQMLVDFYETEARPLLARLGMLPCVLDLAILPANNNDNDNDGDEKKCDEVVGGGLAVGGDVATGGLRRLDQCKVVIIELNPGNRRTGGCLFSWEQDAVLLAITNAGGGEAVEVVDAAAGEAAAEGRGAADGAVDGDAASRKCEMRVVEEAPPNLDEYPDIFMGDAVDNWRRRQKYKATSEVHGAGGAVSSSDKKGCSLM